MLSTIPRTMNSTDDHTAARELIRSGTLVEFRILDVQVQPAPDEAEFGVRVELQLGTEDDEGLSNDVDWGAFGFLFVLGMLSFADARPRGYSEEEFQENDEFCVADFLQGLTYVRGELHFRADYLRGRRMKTTIVIRPEGAVTLSTLGRGKTALRWLDRLQGKKTMRVLDGGAPG